MKRNQPEPAERIITGLQPVREAIRAHGGQLKRVLVRQGDSPQLEGLVRFAQDQGITVERAQAGALDRLSGGGRHQGAVAVAPPLNILDLDAFTPQPDGLLVLLDGITDPQNFGACIRSVVALGASGIVWGQNHSAPLSAATFRASAGSVEHAALYRVSSLRSAVQQLGAQGHMTVALVADGPEALPDLDLTGPTVLVVGAEDRGVSRGVRQLCSHRAKLPMAGRLDSLNASVATAIAIYEAQRQRSRAAAQ